MKTIRQKQLTFWVMLWELSRHGFENLVVTGKVEGRRATSSQQLKYMDSLTHFECMLQGW